MIKISSLLFVMVAMMLSACDDYLDDVPKGQKIPKTWEDYNAFILSLIHISEPTRPY